MCCFVILLYLSSSSCCYIYVVVVCVVIIVLSLCIVLYLYILCCACDVCIGMHTPNTIPQSPQMHIQEVVFEPATPPSTTATPDTPTTTPRPVPPPPAAVTTLGPPIGAPAAGRSLLLGRGDVCSVLFPIRCTEQGVGQSLGVLRVKWRRGGVTGVGRGKEEKEGAVWSETLKPSQPYPVAEVVLPLPLGMPCIRGNHGVDHGSVCCWYWCWCWFTVCELWWCIVVYRSSTYH